MYLVEKLAARLKTLVPAYHRWDTEDESETYEILNILCQKSAQIFCSIYKINLYLALDPLEGAEDWATETFSYPNSDLSLLDWAKSGEAHVLPLAEVLPVLTKEAGREKTAVCFYNTVTEFVREHYNCHVIPLYLLWNLMDDINRFETISDYLSCFSKNLLGYEILSEKEDVVVGPDYEEGDFMKFLPVCFLCGRPETEEGADMKECYICHHRCCYDCNQLCDDCDMYICRDHCEWGNDRLLCHYCLAQKDKQDNAQTE